MIPSRFSESALLGMVESIEEGKEFEDLFYFIFSRTARLEHFLWRLDFIAINLIYKIEKIILNGPMDRIEKTRDIFTDTSKFIEQQNEESREFPLLQGKNEKNFVSLSGAG